MSQTFANRLLSRLPEAERQVVLSHLSAVELHKGQVLEGPGHRVGRLYFLERGVVCLVASLDSGDSVAVALTGSEGVAGAPAILGADPGRHRLLVAIPGSGFCMDGGLLRTECATIPNAIEWVERYVQVVVAQVMQSAICNRYHSGRERLARWLLLASDAAGTPDLSLTHASLAQMVGGARSLVTTALSELRQQQAVEHRRGVVTLHRPLLVRQACECYATVAHAVRGFLAH